MDCIEIIAILDKEGRNLGYSKARVDSLENFEYALVVHVWILNSEGKFLVQQRSRHKKVDPLLWSTTAGFVRNNETSIETLRRELREELDYELKNTNVKSLRRLFPKDGTQHIADVYVIEENINLDDVMLQVEEVEQVAFCTKEQIKEGLDAKAFNNFDNMYENYYKYLFEEE